MAMGNKSKTTNINCLKVKNNLLSDLQQIANELNEYFCNTTKRVEEEFPQSSEKVRALDSNAYLTHLPKNFRIFRFRRLTPTDIVKSIPTLKNSHSGNIPALFLKDASMCVASSLSV